MPGEGIGEGMYLFSSSEAVKVIDGAGVTVAVEASEEVSDVVVVWWALWAIRERAQQGTEVVVGPAPWLRSGTPLPYSHSRSSSLVSTNASLSLICTLLPGLLLYAASTTFTNPLNSSSSVFGDCEEESDSEEESSSEEDDSSDEDYREKIGFGVGGDRLKSRGE